MNSQELEEQLQETKRQLTEERRRREEEQRRREEAEMQLSQTDVWSYISSTHKLWKRLPIVMDSTLTTQGDTTRPGGRVYPQRIVPWDEFPDQQQASWKILSKQGFIGKRAYPSAHQLEYILKYIEPISSELGVRTFARDGVENPVKTLIEEVYKDTALREYFRLRGNIRFENHLNLGPSTDAGLDEAMQSVSLSDPRDETRLEDGAAQSLNSPKRKRRGGLADQFCIYQLDGGRNVPAVAIEYKAPHKLTREEVLAGLKGEIRPAEDIINKNGEGFEFLSRCLLAAVVTQCFSYMIARGIQFGYIFTGDVFVLLRIPDDPTVVSYYVCIPGTDVYEHSEDKLCWTAVAQIFIFVLLALGAEPPSQSWRKQASKLELWAVEYVDILRMIPESDRKSRDPSAYKPGRWKPFVRSPIRLRYRCAPAEEEAGIDSDHDSTGEEDETRPTTPTPHSNAQPSGRTKGTHRRSETDKHRKEVRDHRSTKIPIKERLFCTHQCILGLLYGRLIDENCPNYSDHSSTHLRVEHFLALVRQQLEIDDGKDADCEPLYLCGSRGALFKVRLSSYGYTFVTKGVEEANTKRLQHELGVYHHLRSLQGTYIPVCLGIVQLKVPYYFNGWEISHMLCMSSAGVPLFEVINNTNKSRLFRMAEQGLREIHAKDVFHGDTELRNLTYNSHYDQLMWVDLERAKVRTREPLSLISPNRKRKREETTKKSFQGRTEFSQEMRLLYRQYNHIL